MDAGTVASILIALIGSTGLYKVAKVNMKSSDAASTVKSALELQERYEKMNKDLTAEIKLARTDFNNEMNEIKKQMHDMKERFEEKENYYKSEIEKRDDENDVLRMMIHSKDLDLERKDLIIFSHQEKIRELELVIVKKNDIIIVPESKK